MQSAAESRQVILSGCSGGGKSTLLAELRRRGFVIVEEPGRRIVAEEMGGDNKALPWVDLEAFARRAIDIAIRDRARVKSVDGWVFFDRGLIDAAVALEHATGAELSATLAGLCRFHQQVFLTPPWPEVYRMDGERQQGIAEGIREYHRLLDAFEQLGYDLIILPKVDIDARADFVIECLS